MNTKQFIWNDHSLISDCFTKITVISIGKHQISTEFVFRTKTFLITACFIPLRSFPKPMLVCKFKNIMKDYLGSALTLPEWVLRTYGVVLSEMLVLLSNPG